MNWWGLGVFVLVILLFFAFKFLIKQIKENGIPAYMQEKGKNIATKQDIQEITRKTEEVQQEFRKDIEKYNSDLHFKYDYYYKQYTELYCYLYAIVVQSEYVKRFLKLDGSFDELPFVEISKTKRRSWNMEFHEGKPIHCQEREEEIETPISQFNKDELVEYIIKHGELASQTLLKLAVSYRFAAMYYAGKSSDPDIEKKANDEEVRLIGEIVKCIVKEYNFYREQLNMSYSEKEKDTGLMTFDGV